MVLPGSLQALQNMKDQLLIHYKFAIVNIGAV
jgi:hypothetical protein